MNAHESMIRIVDRWASQNGAMLACNVQGFPEGHCFAYVSSGRGERCQVVVEAPAQGVVTVRVRELESMGNDQLSEIRHVTIAELAATLDDVSRIIDAWFARQPPLRFGPASTRAGDLRIASPQYLWTKPEDVE